MNYLKPNFHLSFYTKLVILWRNLEECTVHKLASKYFATVHQLVKKYELLFLEDVPLRL